MSSDITTAQEALTFADLGLSPKVLSAVTDAGYTVPTPIQAGAIPHALQGKDVLGIAQTGTGKTAAFVLPMITRLEKGRARARMPRTLILEPTRELAAQVEENFIKYGKNHKLNIALLIGGVSFDEQDKKLERGADVLDRHARPPARPPRARQAPAQRRRDPRHRRGRPHARHGLHPRHRAHLRDDPVVTRQTLFFSATMPPEITKLTEKFLHAPVRVEVSKAASTGTNITQRLVKSGPKPWDKRETLRNLIKAEADSLKNAIIFCNRKVEVSELYKSLVKYEFDAGALHGDMDQRARMAMLESFRSGKLKLLVASDVAARGLDIPDVSHVFNFDVPIHAEDYVHRIGRTGRAGRSGKAFTIVTRSDTKYLDAIERLTGLKIEWHDGDLSTVVASEGDDEAPRRGRGAPRRAGRKDESDRRGDRKRGARPPRCCRAEKPVEQVAESAEAPVADIAEERRARKDAIKSDNAGRGATSDNAQRPHRSARPARDDRSDRPRRDDKRHHRRDDDVNDGTVGFGDDMPAFMRIAAKV